MTSKVCSKCKQEYDSIPEFWYKDKSRPDGLEPYCKSCSREKVRLWRKNNPERSVQASLNWAANNPSKRSKIEKRYRDKNPVKMAARSARRRSYKLAADGSFTKEEIQELRIQQDNRCFHCGVSFDEKKMNIDHWIPLSRGGSNWISNIRLLCEHCNFSKNDKLPWEWSEKYTMPEQQLDHPR